MRTDEPAVWFRLYSEFATDPKVQMLSEVDQRRFVMLLCMRCSNGDVTLHDDEIAFQLRISVQDWCATKDVLAQKMLIDAHNKPCAWEKRQFSSDSSVERVRRHRSKNVQQRNGYVTLQSRPVETETETETETEDKNICTTGVVLAHPTLHNDCANSFDQFWSAYPKRKNRGRAEKAWAKLKPDAGLIAKILAAVEVAKAGDDWSRDGGKYIPYPETWLNAKGWMDDVSAACYGLSEVSVMEEYSIALTDGCGWSEVSMTPFSPERAIAIREFLSFSDKPEWVKRYFDWIAQNLEYRDGYGFDWVIRRDVFLRAKEGNFSALKVVV